LTGNGASFELTFAALLVGVDAKTAAKIGRRLRLSNDELDRVVWLVANRSALVGASTQPNSVLYPTFIHPGIGELIALTRAEGHPADADFCEQLIRTTPREVLNPPPLLTGDDLTAMGLKPGPLFKQLLTELRTLQLDGELRTRADAEEKIRERLRNTT
jgi:poly(A) polymerase